MLKKLFFWKNNQPEVDEALMLLIGEADQVNADVWRYNIGVECLDGGLDAKKLFSYAFHMGLKEELVAVEGIHNKWPNFKPEAGDIVFLTVSVGEGHYELVAICDVLTTAQKHMSSDGKQYMACSVEYMYSFSEYEGGRPRIDDFGNNPRGNGNFYKIPVRDAVTSLYHSQGIDDENIRLLLHRDTRKGGNRA
ncbi:hypothetical protein [Hyphococcus sp.]|uniref:hypothetical protein n=1 Tax=Hyphococcus sp. TaxID=2038636 RepID=UPI0035C6C762